MFSGADCRDGQQGENRQPQLICCSLCRVQCLSAANSQSNLNSYFFFPLCAGMDRRIGTFSSIPNCIKHIPLYPNRLIWLLLGRSWKTPAAYSESMTAEETPAAD